jgi:hypothetical protein
VIADLVYQGNSEFGPEFHVLTRADVAC